MKIWLNNKKAKESDIPLPCHYCVFNREILYHQFRSTCLLRILNVRSDHDWCLKGYCYENMA